MPFKFRIIFIIMIVSSIYAQCSDLDENACNHPLFGQGCEWIGGSVDCDNMMTESNCNTNDCDWIEDFNNYSCSGFSQNQCYQYEGCDWTLSYGGSYGSWSYTCSGSYQMDNSYCDGESGSCEEIEILECSGMNEIECDIDDSCDWVENITEESCYYTFNSYAECIANGCSWYSPGNYGYMGSHCYGSYQNDSSYCEELSGDDGGLADPTVFLSIGNDIDISNRIIYIDMISEEEVGGFQFLLSDTPDNITIIGAGGGITEESGFTISSSEMGIVVAFSFTGSTILPGEYTLFEYYFEINNEELTNLCIEDIVFSDPNGGAIEVDFAGCISTFFENINMGDANGDGALDILDIVIVVDNIITGGEYLQVADMNDDGSIDVLDIIIIVGMILDS